MVKPRLLAAVVEVDITPPAGERLEGYAAREGFSEGIHDPLLAQVLLLSLGKKQVALVSLDLLAVGLDFTHRVRAGVSGALSIPPEAVMLACSHTHSGAAGFLPELPMLRSAPDPELQEMVARKLVGAAISATRNLEPVNLRFGRGEVRELGSNRNDPQTGLNDPQVTLLLVEDLEGCPLAVWYNFGCHPTILGYDNMLVSADYPGATRMALQAIYPEATFMFTNGAAGDVSTRFTRRGQGFPEVERLGLLLAGEVLKRMQLAEPLPVDQLAAAVQEVDLPLRAFPAVEQAEVEVKRLQAALDELKSAGAPAGEIRKATTRVEGAQGQADMARFFGGKTATRSELQVMQIGPLGLVGMPGEAFSRTVLEIKAQSPLPYTAVISYANDYQGYFPDAVSVAQGTYEALVSPYAADLADHLRSRALQMLADLSPR